MLLLFVFFATAMSYQVRTDKWGTTWVRSSERSSEGTDHKAANLPHLPTYGYSYGTYRAEAPLTGAEEWGQGRMRDGRCKRHK